jgi:hypothetical protein
VKEAQPHISSEQIPEGDKAPDEGRDTGCRNPGRARVMGISIKSGGTGKNEFSENETAPSA